MLIVTVEKLPGQSDGRRTLGEARIVNIGGDAGYGAFEVVVVDHHGHVIGRGEIKDYPRFASTTVWDLVLRAVNVALSGTETIPPRPVYNWNQ